MTRQWQWLSGVCPICAAQELAVLLSDSNMPAEILCSNEDCPDPRAAGRILQDPEVEHIVTFASDGFVIRHPLRERLGDALMECEVHEDHAAMGSSPVSPGKYRVTAVDDEDEPYLYEPVFS